MENIQITLRDLPHDKGTKAIEDLIRKKAEKFPQYYHRIISTKVVVEQTQRHKHQGKLYCLRVEVAVPRKVIVVNKKENEDIYIAIRDAFYAAGRQLEDFARRQRGEVKRHDTANKGVIKRLFPNDGYGFIEGNDSNEYYFSTTNVAFPTFDQLQVGDLVGFLTAGADDGLQAHRVTRERNHSLAA